MAKHASVAGDSPQGTRSRERRLAWLMYAAITLLVFALYQFDLPRGVVLGLAFVILLPGMSRLGALGYWGLVGYALGGYALAIAALMQWQPQAFQGIAQEWFHWLLLAVSLPWFAVIGGKLRPMRDGLEARAAQLHDVVAQLQELVMYDEVTGLYSRSFFTQSLRHALAQAQRSGRSVAVLFADVDRFKLINDTLGHAAADRVLREVGRRISACVRASDIVARLGGDDFALLIEDLRDASHLPDLAEKLLRAVARPMLIDGREIPLSASIGVAVGPEDGGDESELLNRASAAMYRAKGAGRGQYRFYARALSTHAADRLALESELAHAVERGELRLHFQPKAEAGGGKIVGAEALLRWQHPRFGLTEPARFIDIAEDSGAIVAIGRWVLHQACQHAAAWSRALGIAVPVAVNLSSRQFADPGLLADIDQALAASGLDPKQLEIEITESMLMANPEQAATLLRALRQRGVRVSMDDFGTGYSSLSYLKRFPFDAVKIDRSFVEGLPHDPEDAAIVRAIIAMTHNLHMKVIAEGVERREQLDFLRAEGCEEYQGYYCARPVPESELLERLVPEARIALSACERQAPGAPELRLVHDGIGAQRQRRHLDS